MEIIFRDAAILFTIATCLSYFFAYIYEWSYANYYMIPDDLIEININILTRFLASAITFFLIFFIVVTGIERFLITFIPEKYLQNVFKNWEYYIFGFLLTFVIEGKQKYWLILAILIILILDILPGKLKTIKKNECVNNASKKESRILKFLERYFGNKIFVFIIILFFLIGFFYLKAISDAENKEYYLISGNWIVLKIYSDRAICAKYDPIENKLYRNFLIIDIKGRDFNFELKKIGKLVVKR